MEKAGVVHAADRFAEQLQETRPVEARELLGERSFAARPEEVAGLDAVGQEEGHEVGGAARLQGFGEEQRRGGGNAGLGEGAGHLPRAGRLAAAEALLEPAAGAAAGNCLTTTSSGPSGPSIRVR